MRLITGDVKIIIAKCGLYLARVSASFIYALIIGRKNDIILKIKGLFKEKYNEKNGFKRICKAHCPLRRCRKKGAERYYNGGS